MSSSSAARHLDEMIVLYTLDKLDLRSIADRFGCTHEAVRLLLSGAGVQLRNRGTAAVVGREKRAPAPKPEHAERMRDVADRRSAADLAAELDTAHREHIRAVSRAHGGKGFPFLTFRSAA